MSDMGTSRLNNEMKSQIASMLKNVIDDDQQDKDSFDDELKEAIFNQSDEDEGDEDTETQTNTTIDQIGFSRAIIEKSLTSKMDKPISFARGHANELFIALSEISRKTVKKFQTINMKFNPFIPIEGNGSSCYNQLYPFGYSNALASSFNMGIPLMPLSNSYITQSYLNGFVSQMPSKRKQMEISSDDGFMSQLEVMLSAERAFTKEIFEKLKGSFILLCKNQQGSRLGQCCIDNTSSDIIHLIFSELKEQIAYLLLDPYANYFCLKLFDYLCEDDRIAFLEKTVELFDVLCVNKIATYPVQCIVEKVSSLEEKTIIAQASYNCLMKLALDVYGTHVLEKIMTCFDSHLIRPISLFVLDNFCFLSNHSNGLCVIKKEIVLENQQDLLDRLRRELISNALVLIQNPYGNYALQTAINNWDISYTKDIMIQFIGKCSVLSIQKYSSNVIERCMEKSERFLCLFINELYLNPCTMTILMKNNFGNYVIQTALKTAKFSSKCLLINIIQSTFDRLNDRKLICKWKSIILNQVSH